MSLKHERLFLHRLNVLRRWLKPHTEWVEAGPDDTAHGEVIFHLAEHRWIKQDNWGGSLRYSQDNEAGGFRKLPEGIHAGYCSDRAIAVYHPACKWCKDSWKNHFPPGGQCMFQATAYDHDD